MINSRLAKVVLGLFFLLLLATPFAIKQMSTRQAVASMRDSKEAALARHGFYLEEVAHAAGIDFVHQAPAFDPKLDPIMPLAASMGAAVSIVIPEGRTRVIELTVE